MQSYIFPCNCANIFSSAILLFCCKIFRLGVCCCFIVGCVNNSNGVGNFYEKIFEKIWWIQTSCVTLHRFWQERALSSAGSERLPYKQRVGGSNPSAPTSHIHPRGSHHPPHRQDADRKFYSPMERCRSGRSGRSRKPLCSCGHPGFESLSFR